MPARTSSDSHPAPGPRGRVGGFPSAITAAVLVCALVACGGTSQDPDADPASGTVETSEAVQSAEASTAPEPGAPREPEQPEVGSEAGSGAETDPTAVEIPKAEVDLSSMVISAVGHPLAFRRAMEAYERGEYEVASARLAAINRLVPEASDPWFYRGVSLLLAGQPEEAPEVLTRALATGSRERITASRFYLGLSRLQLGDLPNAQQELREAAQGEGRHARLATDLLARI